MNIEYSLYIKRVYLAVICFVRYLSLRKIINIVLVEYERFIGRALLKSKPYFYKVEPTNFCNAGCIYCLKKNDINDKTDLSVCDFSNLVSQVKSMAVIFAMHHNGEPLLNPNIYKMISIAHNNGIGTYMSTNFEHFAEEDIPKILNSGLDLLSVSIDSLTDSESYKNRNKPMCKDILPNLSKLIAEKKRQKRLFPIINLQFIITAFNESEIDNFKKIFRNIGANLYTFKPLGTFDTKILPKNKKFLRAIYRKKMIRKNCWWLWCSMIYLSDNYVKACCFSQKKLYLGNIANIDSERNCDVLLEKRKKMADGNPDKECLNCPIPYGYLFSQTI